MLKLLKFVYIIMFPILINILCNKLNFNAYDYVCNTYPNPNAMFIKWLWDFRIHHSLAFNYNFNFLRNEHAPIYELLTLINYFSMLSAIIFHVAIFLVLPLAALIMFAGVHYLSYVFLRDLFNDRLVRIVYKYRLKKLTKLNIVALLTCEVFNVLGSIWTFSCDNFLIMSFTYTSQILLMAFVQHLPFNIVVVLAYTILTVFLLLRHLILYSNELILKNKTDCDLTPKTVLIVKFCNFKSLIRNFLNNKTNLLIKFIQLLYIIHYCLSFLLILVLAILVIYLVLIIICVCYIL